MIRLIFFLASMIGATLAFVAVVVALVSGVTGLWPLLGAAIFGYVLGWLLAYVIAQRMR